MFKKIICFIFWHDDEVFTFDSSSRVELLICQRCGRTIERDKKTGTIRKFR